MSEQASLSEPELPLGDPLSNRGKKSMQRSEYENKLRALNFEHLGKGMYANVFAIPNTDKVIKVASNDAWPDYIKWATKNGYAGKFAPKVYSLKFHDGWYVAIMERLVDTMKNFRVSSEQYQLYYDHVARRSSDIPARSSKGKPKDLIEFVHNLRDAGLANDLHQGNVMVRKDGQLVITDPSHGGFSSERFRIKNSAFT